MYPGGEHFHHGGLDLLPPLDPSDQEEPLHTPRLLALHRDRPIFVLRGGNTKWHYFVNELFLSDPSPIIGYPCQ